MNIQVMCHFVVTALKPLLIGKNPLDIEQLWNEMYFGTYKLGVMGTQPSCIAGVDIALWDIKGKVANMPLYRLLGGAARTTFTMYKSIGGGSRMTPDEMLDQVKDAMDQGFKAVKIRMDYGAFNQDADLDKDLEMFRGCRAFLPPDVPLSFDANNGYSVNGAIQQGRRFEELGIYHFEEPVAQYNYDGIRQVADALDVPVSAGEHEYTRWQFRDLIQQAKPDILQPDIVKCAGITEMRRICVLAETFDMQVLPHQTQPSIGNAASLHVCSTLPQSTRPHEFTGPRPEMDDLFDDPWEFADGQITIPDRPGLGLTINEKALAGATLD